MSHTKNAVIADANFCRELADEILDALYYSGVSCRVDDPQCRRKEAIMAILHKHGVGESGMPVVDTFAGA